MNVKLIAAIAGGSVLAASSGYLASTALSQEPGEPVSTTTITLTDGPAGPAGPPGPPGPAGTFDCGTGFHLGVVVVNHPGGQLTVKTCVKD